MVYGKSVSAEGMKNLLEDMGMGKPKEEKMKRKGQGVRWLIEDMVNRVRGEE